MIPEAEIPPLASVETSSHEIFKNNRLTSQFLSNYTGIQMLAGVKPEDIEDVTERYHAFLGIEFESDTIKKVRLHRTDGILTTSHPSYTKPV